VAGDKGHFGDESLDILHVPVDTLGKDDAGCLTGHLASFRDFGNKKSCNYRWQCYEENKVNKKISLRLHTYEKRFPAARVRTDLTISNPKDWLIQYCFFVTKPQFGDWHIGGPYRDIRRSTFRGSRPTIKEGENFTRALWPYYNNAHHIIPKGTLRRMIAELDNEQSGLSDIVQQALLKVKYNVNHGLNLIFLPMDKRIGSILRLPRHLERRALKSHPVYDDYVAARLAVEDEETKTLSKIMNEYADLAKNAQTESQDPHEIPDAELSKAQLEELSGTLLTLILAWGAAGTGASLDDESA